MRFAVAVSGGRDSTALLHCALHQAAPLGLQVCALHVHHGLNPAAAHWAAHVRGQVRRWAARGLPVSFQLHRVDGRPAAGDSVEAWARKARYAALASMARQAGCDTVLLAHHRRDQSETVLLQALRGAGAAGLSAMPRQVLRDGIHWLRPWLQMPREQIESYVQRHRLGFVDDGSNADIRFARNRLRSGLWPELMQAFPDAETTLPRVARRAQEARECLAELAAMDLNACVVDDAVDVPRWLSLSPARRANALRAWLAHRGTRPDDSLVQRLLDQLPASTSARWPTAGGMLGLHRGRLRMLPDDGAQRPGSPIGSADSVRLDLSRPGRVSLPTWHGALVIEPTPRGGLPPELLRDAECRRRTGGELFQLGPGRPARSLKKQYQTLGVPSWQRAGPLVFTRSGLAFVPGLGMDSRLVHETPGPALSLRWEADVRQS